MQKNTFRIGTLVGALLVTAYFIAAFNTPVIAVIAEKHGIHRFADYLFLASAVLLLGIIVNLVISLLAFKHVFKPWVIFLLISGSIASYYMKTYHVSIDRDMIQNVMETDYSETRALLSPELVMQILIFGILPSLLLLYLPVHYHSTWKELAKKGLVATASCVGIGAISLMYYQDYASLFRNNHHLRDEIIPLDYVYAGYSYARSTFAVPPGTMLKLGEDASAGPAWKEEPKMAVVILVVGETARAANFSLGGYTRSTNPELQNQDIIYFNHFYSCGTATAVSVPCMFSNLGKANYEDAVAKHQENLLDVIAHAGIPVVWRDNNSGCKGVCERVVYEDLGHAADTELCNSNECFDEILLSNLQQKIDAYQQQGKQGVVFVLHQHGSHGPDYFERVPPAFHRFTPYCRTNQIQLCTQQEIVNSYDNTILYTDHVLSLAIDFFKAHQSRYDGSLLYLSDHGESLGENNLYLHGLPYSIAPDEQVHIPALLWMSDGYATRFHFDKSCLQQESGQSYSHDNLFHSVLGLLDIHSAVYDKSQDLFHSCSLTKNPA